MREEVRVSGPLKRATVSCEASRSLMIETDDMRPVKHLRGVIDVDLGVSAFATLSNGDVVEGPKAHGVALKRLRRANKTLAFPVAP